MLRIDWLTCGWSERDVLGTEGQKSSSSQNHPLASGKKTMTSTKRSFSYQLQKIILGIYLHKILIQFPYMSMTINFFRKTHNKV